MTAIRLFFRRARPAPIALSLLAVVLTVLLTLAADRLLGCFGPPPGLIYPPHSRARYKTFEYDFTAVINGLGFRDREFETPKSSTCRIIGLGDSFTYGWGVNLEQCWLKLLEAHLAAQGLTAEVANLGKPGAGPEYYTELAARAIPLLQPDLVLVAMLQGDDLQSLAAPKQRPPFLASLLKRLYPHLTAWRSRGQRADITWQETRQEWQKEAQELLAHFTGEEKARFQNVAEFVQRIFLAGELNPAVVSTAVRQPDYFAAVLNPADPDRQALIRQLAAQLKRLQQIAGHYGAQVLVLSIPNDVYVSEENWRRRQQAGYRVTPEMLTTTAMDTEVQAACGQAGLRFWEATRLFRQQGRTEELFFAWDGHLNPQGHALLAQTLSSALAAYLKEQ